MVYALLLGSASLSGLLCPITGSPVAPDSKMVDANGIRFRFCSPECSTKFKLDPIGNLRAASAKGWTVGVGVFDPVTGRKLTPQSARGGSSDFGGVRFAFQSAANKAMFDSDPKRYGVVPERWSPTCPVMGLELAHTYGAPGYIDRDGVRYFACCDQCMPKLRSTDLSHAKTGPPKAFDVPAVWAKLSGPGF